MPSQNGQAFTHAQLLYGQNRTMNLLWNGIKSSIQTLNVSMEMSCQFKLKCQSVSQSVRNLARPVALWQRETINKNHLININPQNGCVIIVAPCN